MLSETETETLVSQFRDFLQQAERDAPEMEDGPQSPPDLYSLLVELASLKAEVKKEARQHKEAIGHFNTLLESLQANNRQLAQELGQQHAARQEAIRHAQHGLLAEIIDLQERLEATVAGIRSFRPPRWERSASQAFRSSLLEGLEITLRRNGQLLASHGMVPVAAVGKPLDPHTMRVIGVRTERGQVDGVVLEETRRGYLHQGKPFRLAEVVANRTEH